MNAVMTILTSAAAGLNASFFFQRGHPTNAVLAVALGACSVYWTLRWARERGA